ncbi:unnamed protein product [Ectocarpus sp. 8 AP-2014]
MVSRSQAARASRSLCLLAPRTHVAQRIHHPVSAVGPTTPPAPAPSMGLVVDTTIAGVVVRLLSPGKQALCRKLFRQREGSKSLFLLRSACFQATQHPPIMLPGPLVVGSGGSNGCPPICQKRYAGRVHLRSRNLPNTCMCAYLTRLLPEPSFFTRLRRLPQPPSNLAKIQHMEKGAQKQRNQVREGAFSQRPRLSCLPPPSPPL